MDEVKKGTPLYDNLRKVITLIDELRDIGLQQHIALPRISVLGTQSAGKSSLLESIVGLDFLPRGDGVVTRRPLELRLVHVPHGEKEKPYAIFDQFKDKKFFEFDKVRDMINQLTDELCGTKKDIIDKPITLTVYSHSCPDLTLIDLPGITRIAIAGQQQNIEQVTKDMSRRYCGDQRTIILCVIPANQDMSTSDSLQMAKELDPKGTRTLGVITKIDIMDKGTNAKKMLLGEEIPLRLGYVGVKGRSKFDIDNNCTVKQGLDAEKQYFASHPVYSTMPPGHVGTEILSQKLTKILFNHIRNYLPEITKEINLKMRDCEDRLKDLGTALPSTTREKIHLLWGLSTRFSENFKNAISGRYDARSDSVVDQDISGAARIKAMFAELYGNYIDASYRATNDYTDRDIEKAMIMHEGDSIPGFPSIDAFLYLLQPQLEKLKEPAMELITYVYGFLEELALGIMNKLYARFPQILDIITDIVIRNLQSEREKTRKIVEQVIEAEESYLFTTDIDYLTNLGAFFPKTNTKEKDNRPQDPTKIFVTELRNRIDAYFNLVCRNVRDSVPKIIGTFLVRAAQDNMQFALYDEINKNEELLHMLGEPESVTVERETLNRTLETLKRAIRAIKKDPDLAATARGADDDEEEEKPRSKNVDNRGQQQSNAQPSTSQQQFKIEKPEASQSRPDPNQQKQATVDPKNQDLVAGAKKPQPTGGSLFGKMF
jgi:GTP-binding protein EngB required for normal cell division